MSTEAFKQAKAEGRWFEDQIHAFLESKGAKVVDTDQLSYRKKKGKDRLVSINGCAPVAIECKYDRYVESTGRVCIEVGAVRSSESPIWVYGLKHDDKVYAYSMFLKDLAEWVEQEYGSRKQKIYFVGEFKVPALCPDVTDFLTLPFVKKCTVITIKQPQAA